MDPARHRWLKVEAARRGETMAGFLDAVLAGAQQAMTPGAELAIAPHPFEAGRCARCSHLPGSEVHDVSARQSA